MPSPSASHEEVRELLGEVDELVIERIIDTGASVDEIAEALGAIEDGHQLSEQPYIPSTAAVVEVRRILDEVLEDQDDDDVMAPTYGDQA